MVIGNDKVVRYEDNLILDSFEIKPDGSLETIFPTETGKQLTILLKPAAKENARATWKAHDGARIYKATAVPYSEETFCFRLEVLRDTNLVAGAQVFCGVCKAKGQKSK
jgi:hypothetical protein